MNNETALAPYGVGMTPTALTLPPNLTNSPKLIQLLVSGRNGFFVGYNSPFLTLSRLPPTGQSANRWATGFCFMKGSKAMMTLSEREKAIRAAAFIDTDGCICINKPLYLLVCKMSSTTPRLVNWMKQEYGGSVQKSERIINDGYNRLPLYEWRLASEKAEKFLRIVLPFLMIKSEQARCGFTLRETQGHHMRKVPHHIKVQGWEQCYQQMRKLNTHRATIK